MLFNPPAFTLYLCGDKRRHTHPFREAVVLLLGFGVEMQKRRGPLRIQSSVFALYDPGLYRTSRNVSSNAIYSQHRRTAWNWQWRLLCLANNARRECKAWNSLRSGEDEGESEMRDKPRGKAAGKSEERKPFIVLAAPNRLSPERRSASWWKSERRSGWGILVW